MYFIYFWEGKDLNLYIDRILDKWSFYHDVQGRLKTYQDAILLNAWLIAWDVINPLLAIVYFYVESVVVSLKSMGVCLTRLEPTEHINKQPSP